MEAKIMEAETKERQRGFKGDGTVYQRGDGIWCAKYRPKKGGKPKVLYAKSETEARKKLQNFKKEVHKNDYVEVEKITVEEYMTRWFEDVKMIQLKPKSIDRVEQNLRHQIFPLIGDIQLGALTADDVQGMITKLSKKYAYDTIKKSYDNVNSCLKLGILKKHIGENPCIGITLPTRLEKEKKKVRFFPKEEAEKICEEAVAQYSNGKRRHRLGHSVIVMTYTGMCIGELLGLKWKNIDFENKTATIEDSIVMVKNRGKAEDDDTAPKYKLIEQNESLKTEARQRIIQLNKKAIAALKAIQEFNGKHKYVMATENGSVFSPRNFDRMLRSICKECELEPCGAHVLRHTFASMLFRAGVDVKAVSELLGHSDVTVTYNTYIHLIKEQKHQAVAILDDL